MSHQSDNRATHIRSDGAEESAQAQTKIKEQNAQAAEEATVDPAAERGERMEAGKAVARAGKPDGKVPGTEKSQ